MEKVTKWHCFLADYSYYIAYGYTKDPSFKSEVLSVNKNNLNSIAIGLVCVKATEKTHSHINQQLGYYRSPGTLSHSFYGTKRKALRSMLPHALEAVAGDMAATVKLMKFMEDNGLDLEEEALE